MTDSIGRVVEMLDVIATTVTQIRLGACGARAGVSEGSWTDIELRALHDRLVDLEILLGRFKAELHGQEYIFPPSGDAPARGQIN